LLKGSAPGNLPGPSTLDVCPSPVFAAGVEFFGVTQFSVKLYQTMGALEIVERFFPALVLIYRSKEGLVRIAVTATWWGRRHGFSLLPLIVLDKHLVSDVENFVNICTRDARECLDCTRWTTVDHEST
jgi:hypothetical protein